MRQCCWRRVVRKVPPSDSLPFPCTRSEVPGLYCTSKVHFWLQPRPHSLVGSLVCPLVSPVRGGIRRSSFPPGLFVSLALGLLAGYFLDTLCRVMHAVLPGPLVAQMEAPSSSQACTCILTIPALCSRLIPVRPPGPNPCRRSTSLQPFWKS